LARYTQGSGIDEPLASVTGLGAAFFEADGLGSVTSLSGASGVTDTYTYKPFGITTANGSNPNRFRFTGREWDQEAGLYYYRARYYDPAVGRFISEDPIAFEGGVDFYAYVQNNAANYADPFGLCQLASMQCKAIRTLLDRESLFGTGKAAGMSAIGFGDNTLQPFNSSVSGQAYVQTALGTVKLDWFTDISIVKTSVGRDVAYFSGKLIWSAMRK